MTTTTPDAGELTDLAIHLNEAIPCEHDKGCDLEATWRATAVHYTPEAACVSMFLCDKHTTRLRRLTAFTGPRRPLKALCAPHRTLIWLRWTPLHPNTTSRR